MDGNRFMTDQFIQQHNSLGHIALVSRVARATSRLIQQSADIRKSAWENLASAIGNQYINEAKSLPATSRRALVLRKLVAQPRGTSDTSRIATDHINIRMRSMRSSSCRTRNASPCRKIGGQHARVTQDRIGNDGGARFEGCADSTASAARRFAFTSHRMFPNTGSPATIV